MNALDAARRTSALAGRRIWLYSRWLPTYLLVGGVAAAAVTLTVLSLPGLAFLPFLLALLASAAIARHSRTVLHIHNQGVAARGAGDFARAERQFVEALTHGGTRLLGCIALENLAGLALERGAFDDAATLARAAISLSPPRREGRRNDYRARPQGTLALALICSGDLDAAERVLDEALAPGAGARDRMFLVAPRALLLLRRDRPDEVFAWLDQNRAVARNSFGAETWALCEAIEGLALQRLGGAYRGGRRRSAPLPCLPRTRAYVDRIAPGGGALLDELAANPR
jgi:hypothetical protein